MHDTAEKRWETSNERGCKLFAQGDYAGAEEAFIDAIKEATLLGADNLRLASSISNFGQLKYKQKDFGKAESLFRRALDIRQRLLGMDHQGLLQGINNLAALYYARGELNEAEALFRRALSITERQLGFDHPDVAVALNSLARLLFRKNDYRSAAPLLLRLLKIKQDALGGDHPEIAAILTSMAKVRCAEGDYDAAEQVSRRALAVREKALPDGDPAIATSLEALAEICQLRGKHDEELSLLERALALRERASDGDSPALANTRARVAALRDDRRLRPPEDRVLDELAEMAGIDVLPEPPATRFPPSPPPQSPARARVEAPAAAPAAAQAPAAAEASAPLPLVSAPMIQVTPPESRRPAPDPVPVVTPSIEPVWKPEGRFDSTLDPDSLPPATMFSSQEPRSQSYTPWTPPAAPVVYRPRTPPRGTVSRPRREGSSISGGWNRRQQHRRRMAMAMAAIAAISFSTWLVLGRERSEEDGGIITETSVKTPVPTGDSLVGGYSVARRPATPPPPAPTFSSPAMEAAATLPERVAPAPPPRVADTPTPRRGVETTPPRDSTAVPSLAVPGVELDRVTREIESRRARLDSINRVTVKPPVFEKQP